MTNAVTDYLKYANLQMAAESLFGQKGKLAGSVFSGLIDAADLKTGNERSGKFTDVLAQQFSDDWTVVEHISNTTTIKNWYVGTANQIEEFRLSDGSKVLASEVNGLLSAMAAFVPMDSTTSEAKTRFIDMPISNPNVPPQAWM